MMLERFAGSKVGLRTGLWGLDLSHCSPLPEHFWSHDRTPLLIILSINGQNVLVFKHMETCSRLSDAHNSSQRSICQPNTDMEHRGGHCQPYKQRRMYTWPSQPGRPKWLLRRSIWREIRYSLSTRKHWIQVRQCRYYRPGSIWLFER